MNWAPAHGAAAQYKDTKATDLMPFYDPPAEQEDMHPLDRQAMKISARFSKLGV